MPRVKSTLEFPDYQKVFADVQRLGPLTQAYGEHVAAKMGWRHPNGDKLAYTTRRTRGADFLHRLLFREETTITDVARAVWRFHLDKFVAAETSHVRPYREFK